MQIDNFLQTNNWKIINIQRIPPRNAENFTYDEIGLTNQTKNYLLKNTTKGL